MRQTPPFVTSWTSRHQDGPTALGNLLPADRGAAGAGTSAASQLGSAIGAALLNTIAATDTVSYLAAHATVSVETGTVHGFTVAMARGAAITAAAALPITIFVNAKTPARTHVRSKKP